MQGQVQDELLRPFATSLNFRGKPSRVLANSNCIIIEPESTPKVRTIIPLNQVISVRPCYCKKLSKKLVCECISSPTSRRLENEATASTTALAAGDGPSATSTNSLNHPTSRLAMVRVYYAVAVGEYRWKVTFIPLVAFAGSDIATNVTTLEWISGVSGLLDEFKRPKKLLMFVNPFGGKRKATKIYETKVAPVLQLAGVQVDCIITQRADHARDMIEDASVPLKAYHGLVCVGGDGMFAELLNGVLVRTQREQGTNVHSTESRLVQPNIAIGVIPAGSTDAVAFGVTGTNDPVTSTVHVIFGKRIDIDVSAIHNANEEDRLIRYATSFLAYGYFGDVLLDSESNRWMGPKRYDWAGLKKFLGHRLYNGELKLYVSTADGSPRDDSICQSDCPLCAKSGLRARYGLTDGTSSLVVGNQAVNRDSGDNGDNVQSDPSNCVTIRGRFLAINSATMTCRCDKAKKGISPSAHLGNGCTDLIVVSQCSRLNYLRYLMRTGFLATSPFELPFVDVYRVREFEFTPFVNSGDGDGGAKRSPTRSSVWNCDGEVIKDPSVRVKVHCQLLPVFGSGRENRLTNKGTIGLGMSTNARKVRDLNENRKQWDRNFESSTVTTDDEVVIRI